MIQESINQLLTTAGLAARLSPSYENRQAAKSIYAKGIAAETGLKDIAKSIKRVESGKRPAYSNAELEDIERRVDEHVHNIGTLKTAAIPGQETAPYIPTNKRGRIEGLGTRKSYSKRLQGIESSLSAMKENAMQSMPQKEEIGRTSTIPSDNIEVNKRVMDYLKNKARAKLEQDKQFKELRNIIYYENKDFADAGMEGIVGDDYYVPLDPKGSVMTIEEHDKMDRKAHNKLYERKYTEKYGKNYRNNPEYLKEVQDDIDSIFD